MPNCSYIFYSLTIKLPVCNGFLRPCNGFAVLRRVRNCRVWLIDWLIDWWQFIADDKVVHRRQSTTSFGTFEPEIGWILQRRTPVSRQVSRADRCILACTPDWVRVPPPSQCSRRDAPNAVCCCLVPGQLLLYPSCRFSSADCRRFKVSNPCREIHSTTFVHHIPGFDR